VEDGGQDNRLRADSGRALAGLVLPAIPGAEPAARLSAGNKMTMRARTFDVAILLVHQFGRRTVHRGYADMIERDAADNPR
jgi:hypothetical protein